jgi:phage nucleotide-binding protein
MKITNTRNLSQHRIKAVVYGPSGIGKTSLAKTIDQKKFGKVLILDAEQGSLSLSGFDIDVISITSDDDGKLLPKKDRIARVRSAYSYLMTEKHEYQILIIDSGTELSQIVVESLDETYPNAKDSLQKWGKYSQVMVNLIKAFRDVPQMHVIFLALDKVEKDELGRKTVGIEMSGKISKQILGYFDEVLHMEIQNTESGPARVFLTNTTGEVTAKDRSGKLEGYEPADLSHIFTKILGEPKNNDETKTNETNKNEGTTK